MESNDCCDYIPKRKDGPIPSASKMFAILFLASSFLLVRRMRDKLRASSPPFVLSPDEIAAAVCGFVSLAFYIYRLLRRS